MLGLIGCWQDARILLPPFSTKAAGARYRCRKELVIGLRAAPPVILPVYSRQQRGCMGINPGLQGSCIGCGPLTWMASYQMGI